MSDHSSRERFLRAARGQGVDRAPVWLMRQAGRYLPEYRALKADNSFHQLLEDPGQAAAVTMMPMKRFPLDVAVIFSDLLVPYAAMGHPVTYGPGITVADPIRTLEQVADLGVYDPFEHTPALATTIALVREELPEHAIVGFAGAPFSLAYYLIEGSGSRDGSEVARFALKYPEAFADLLDQCTHAATALLRMQVEAGVDGVQIFDSHGDHLAARDYRRWCLTRVASLVRSVPTGVPTIHFVRGSAHLLAEMQEVGADVLSVDWRTPLDRVDRPVQGNLEPTALFGPVDHIRTRVHEVRAEGTRAKGHIMNLGHGILPGTPLAGVAAAIAAAVEDLPDRSPPALEEA